RLARGPELRVDCREEERDDGAEHAAYNIALWFSAASSLPLFFSCLFPAARRRLRNADPRRICRQIGYSMAVLRHFHRSNDRRKPHVAWKSIGIGLGEVANAE